MIFFCLSRRTFFRPTKRWRFGAGPENAISVGRKREYRSSREGGVQRGEPVDSVDNLNNWKEPRMKYRFAPAELDTSDQTSLDPALNKHMPLHRPVQLIPPVLYWRCPICGQHTFDAEAFICPFCQQPVTWMAVDSDETERDLR
jgi:endogenous inhibitor of DNA gyrase (YacG/DUF329 family)